MKLKEEFVEHVSGKERMLISVNSDFNGVVKANSTAGYIIELLTNEISYDEIVNAMAGKYNADRAVIEQDVRAILKQLESIGAI